MKFLTQKKTWIINTLWIMFFCYSVIHFFIILKLSVNVPFFDEWSLLTPFGVIQGWSKEYLLDFHNEHRLISAKALALINFQIFGLNFKYHIIFNLILYAIIVWMTWKFIGKNIASKYPLCALITFLPFISNSLATFHNMPFNVNIHIFLISFILGTYLLFFKENLFWLGLILLSFSMFNFAGGIASAITVGAIYIAYLFFNKSKDAFFKSILTITVLTISVLGWFKLPYFSSIIPHTPSYIAWPTNLDFYKFFSELISLGFGFSKISVFFSLTCSLLVFLSIFSLISKTHKQQLITQQNFFLLALTLGILSILGLIAFGRTCLTVQHAKGGTLYPAIAFFLPVLTLALFSSGHSSRYKMHYLVVFFVILGYSNNFSFSPYHKLFSDRTIGAQCIKDLFANPTLNEKGLCPTVHDKGILPQIYLAKLLRLSFIPSQD